MSETIRQLVFKVKSQSLDSYRVTVETTQINLQSDLHCPLLEPNSTCFALKDTEEMKLKTDHIGVSS